MFQFLIGRLKTNRLIEEKGWEILFQFLIGRLKTSPVGGYGTGHTSVSIPYR